MKRSNAQFDIRSRQSQWAIIFIVLKHIVRLVSQLWPLGVAYLLGRSSRSYFDQFELIAAAIGTLGMLWGIASFYRFYYYIDGDELVIEKGIFKKVRLNLPFERIQSVNFNQNILHQVLGVTAIEIESAGSDQKELKIDALDLTIANELRSLLLQRKKQNAPTEEVTIRVSDEPKNVILSLSNMDIIKVGLCQNHLQPIGLIFGLMGSIWFYGYTFDFDPIDIFRTLFTRFEGQANLLTGLVLCCLIVICLVGYSIIRTWLIYHDLKFWRSGERFQVTQGLLTRRQFSALDKKVQVISWSQNPLQKLLKYNRLSFSQARSDELGKEQMDFSIPGCSHNQIEQVIRWWLDRDSIDRSQASPISTHYFYHKLIYQYLFFSVITGLVVYMEEYNRLWIVAALFVLVFFVNLLAFTKKKYAFDGRDIYIEGGLLGLKNSIIPVHKVQNLAIVQNPYQSRRNLASLKIYTAAGNLMIPYIKKSKAIALLDDIIYNVEKSKESWM